MMKNVLIPVICLFFFWGFVAANNDILIPVFKQHLSLTQWESQMIAFAFYVAYTLGALIYAGISAWQRHDLVAKLGYGKALSLGLIVSAIGTLLFIPAADYGSFPLLLAGLMVVGLGFSLQQTVANPLTIILGDAKTGSQRLSLAGGINNVGTTIGPILLSFAIFGSPKAEAQATINLQMVKYPYLLLGLLFLLFAGLFYRLKVEKQEDHKPQTTNLKELLSNRQVLLSMLAIFLYVGVEVATASNLPEYLRVYHHIETAAVAPYISLFWASLMIGRWTSAASALGLSKGNAALFRLLLPSVAFLLFIAVNAIAGHHTAAFLLYLPAVGIIVLADWLSNGNPSKQLLCYSVLGIVALLMGMFSSGQLAIFGFVAVGLCCSTLWPCIFALALRNQGDQTASVSNLLIMMIMGGGFISLLQGYLAAPELLGIQYSFAVGIACFLYLALYAIAMKPKATA